MLDGAFEDGGEVSFDSLRAKHLVPKTDDGVKVLGNGEITKKLNLKVQAISPAAKSKIEAVGGTVEIIGFAGAPTAAAEAEAAPSPAEPEAPAETEAPAEAKAADEEAPAEAPAAEDEDKAEE